MVYLLEFCQDLKIRREKNETLEHNRKGNREQENKLTRTEWKRSRIESGDTRRLVESAGHHKKNKGKVEKGNYANAQKKKPMNIQK